MQQPVVAIGQAGSIRLAAQLMADNDVGFLPVCDDDGRVVGVVTDRDIAVRVCAAGRDEGSPVGDVMTRELVACTAADPVALAEERMVQYRKQRILVLDEAGRPIGVIAVADLAAHERYETVGRAYRRIALGEH